MSYVWVSIPWIFCLTPSTMSPILCPYFGKSSYSTESCEYAPIPMT